MLKSLTAGKSSPFLGNELWKHKDQKKNSPSQMAYKNELWKRKDQKVYSPCRMAHGGSYVLWLTPKKGARLVLPKIFMYIVKFMRLGVSENIFHQL